MNNQAQIPEVDSICRFCCNGKVYEAKVEQVITPEEAKHRYAERYNKLGFLRQLTVLHDEIINEGKHPFANETDYFVLCHIDDLKDVWNWIWFVRGINGGWLSLPIKDEIIFGTLIP